MNAIVGQVLAILSRSGKVSTVISFVSRIDWTFVGLLLIILSAPFEQSEPLFELSGQVLTNVEAFVALARIIHKFS